MGAHTISDMSVSKCQSCTKKSCECEISGSEPGFTWELAAHHMKGVDLCAKCLSAKARGCLGWTDLDPGDHLGPALVKPVMFHWKGT